MDSSHIPSNHRGEVHNEQSQTHAFRNGGRSRKRKITLLSLTAIHALVHPSSFATAFSHTGISTIASSKANFSLGLRRSTILYGTVLNNEELSKSSLQTLTVKQLKEKIKELDVPVKISQLKLKADCIEFLLEHYDKKAETSGENSKQGEVSADPSPTTTTPIPSKRRMPRSMPPLQQSETIDMNPSPADTETPNDNSSQTAVSPKDLIFDYVMRRYPPLQKLIELQEEAKDKNIDVDDEVSDHMHPNFFRTFTGLGELDVRQKYHPMLKDMTSSDLDIITVGTASCVPGTTRGVSCTALRLQWRRNAGVENTKANQSAKAKNTPTTGGIWIFDCGESTQVSQNTLGMNLSLELE